MYKLVFITLCLHVLVAMGQLDTLDEPYYGESQSPQNPIVALTKNYENMQAEVNALKTTVATLQGQLNAVSQKKDGLQKNYENMQTIVAKQQEQLMEVSLKKDRPSASCPNCRNQLHMYAFTAVRDYLPRTNIGKGQTIIFPYVLTNYGGMYNQQTGVFTAQVSGLYLFSATLLHEPKKGSLQITLKLSGQKIVLIHAAENMWDGGSQTVVLKVEKGQQVWLENTGENVDTVTGLLFSSFAGVLLGLSWKKTSANTCKKQFMKWRNNNDIKVLSHHYVM